MYHKQNVHLSLGQLKRLSQGARVNLKHHQLDGPHTLFLTHTQKKRIAKAHELQTGTSIKMSLAQLKHHHAHGGNILSDLWNHIKSGATKAAGTLAEKGLERAGSKLLDNLEKRMSGKGFFDDLWGGIKSVGEKVVPVVGNALLNKGIGKLLGGGVKPKRKRKAKAKGDGLFAPGYMY